MEISADGLVFVKLEYDGGGCEFINIASISRIKQMSRQWCKERDKIYPTVQLSLLGVQDDHTISNMGVEDFEKMIKKAIKDHYTDILEKELLS